MCAPCKIILDAGAAAAFRGEDPDAAMADTCARPDVFDQISVEHQDAMSRNDLWLLRQWKEYPEGYEGFSPTTKDRIAWRERLFKILDGISGGTLEGAA